MKNLQIEEAALQDAWLTRIASALVRDSHAAEDLAQDAWVVALRRNRTRTADRPWLGGILRYQAFADRRQRASRLEREQQATRPASSPSAEEVAEQLELRELLARTLGSLDEPFRTAIFLHFVEGRTLRQIAEQLDVGIATAHSRVQTGLERLRRQLDKAHGGGRSAWLGLMAGWHRATPAAASTWSMGASTLALGILVTAAIVGGIFVATQPGATGLIVEPASIEPVPTPAVAFAAVSPSSLRTEPAVTVPTQPPAPAAATTVAAAETPGATIRGTWSKPDGTPATGTQWILEGRGSNQHLVKIHGYPEGWEDLEGTLGADGTLDLSFDPHPAQQYWLKLDHPDFVPMTWRLGRIRPSDAKNLGDLTLRVPGRIQGTLTDPEGGPLGFRTWRIRAKEVAQANEGGALPFGSYSETDDEAAFSIDRLPEGKIQLSLVDRHLGSIPGPLVEVVAGETVSVDFPFSPPAGIGGQALLTCHRLPRALFDAPQPEQLTLVAPDGTRITSIRSAKNPEAYEFNGLEDVEYLFELDDPRLKMMAAPSIRRGKDSQCIVIGNAALQLSVAAPDGSPVEEFSVQLALAVPGSDPRTFTVRGPSHMFKDGRLQGLVPGDYEVTVTAGNFTGVSSVSNLIANETRPLSLTLEGRVVLEGSIRHPDGTPAANVMVRLITPAPEDDRPGLRVLDGGFKSSTPNRFRGFVATTQTNAEGRYSLPLAPAPQLIVLAGDFPGPMAEAPPFEFDGAEPPPGPIDLVLERPARLEGRVTIPDDTNVIGWNVMLLRADSQDPIAESALVREGGHFTLGPTQAGPGHLVLRMLGNAGAVYVTQSGDHPSQDPNLLGEVVLLEGATVTQQFEYPGAPLIHASIAVAGAGLDGEVHRAYVARTPTGPAGFAAANGPEVGPFRLEPGPHSLWLSGTDWIAKIPSVEVPAIEGAVVPVLVHLTEGRVLVKMNGSPIPNRRFGWVNAPNQMTFAQLRTDESGHLDQRLGAGNYELYPNEASPGPGLDFVSSQFEWPLPEGEDSISLEPFGE